MLLATALVDGLRLAGPPRKIMPKKHPTTSKFGASANRHLAVLCEAFRAQVGWLHKLALTSHISRRLACPPIFV